MAGAAGQVVVHDGRARHRLVDRQVEEGEQQHRDEHVDHAVAEADVEEGVVDALPHGRRLVVGEVGHLGQQVKSDFCKECGEEISNSISVSSNLKEKFGSPRNTMHKFLRGM